MVLEVIHSLLIVTALSATEGENIISLITKDNTRVSVHVLELWQFLLYRVVVIARASPDLGFRIILAEAISLAIFNSVPSQDKIQCVLGVLDAFMTETILQMAMAKYQCAVTTLHSLHTVFVTSAICAPNFWLHFHL